MFSIHAFERSDSCIKQVPLMFVIMSGKRKKDSKKVLKAVKSLLPSSELKTITLDFEAAIWQTASDVFTNVKLLGCVFHWSPAVWNKIQAVGLQGVYSNDSGTHSYLRKLLSPQEHINQAFHQLAAQAVTPALQEVCSYIASSWITSTLWPTSSWSAFMRNTRMNNDVEGWHHWLNIHAKKRNLPFYVLIQLLHNEAQATNIEVQLISDKKLKHIQKKCFQEVQGQLFKLWEQYEAGLKSASQLLIILHKQHN